MKTVRWLLCALAAVHAGLVLLAWPRPAPAYIGGPPASLGMMCNWSTHAVVVRLESLDRPKGILVWRKVRDLKGKWPADTVRQNIPAGYPDRQYILDWAEPGKTTVIFALESYKWSHTYIDRHWYAAVTADWQWWNVSHTEPVVLRTFCGKPERLISAATAILAGKEVVVPCMHDGSPQELQQRKAKIQRLKASLKLLDYNPKRDFVGWGSDDFRQLAGMPGFTHYSPLTRVDPEAQAISSVDMDGDGKTDLCLAGAGKVVLLQNDGESFIESPLPGAAGCRAAVWADYNGDGLPDLLLATPAGPRLYTNLGKGAFRDDSRLLPREARYGVTAAAWIDYDGDGRPDVLLAHGYHGLRLYRNLGKPVSLPTPPGKPQPGKPPVAPPAPWFVDVSDRVGLGPNGFGAGMKGDTLTVCDVNGDGWPDFLYGAGTGILFMNTPKGFIPARDSGISYQPGKVGPVFGDFDGDGHPDLFVPQKGRSLLFRNDGTGRFTDVTARAGDLARLTMWATSAAWGDFDNDGRPDLVIGCLRGPNRLLRNRGDGTFEDITDRVGLRQRIFNTQAVCLVDLNNDGVLDMVFNNEGQESCVLLGNPALAAKHTPVTFIVAGKAGVVGSRVRVLDKQGQTRGVQEISGGDGRGGQRPPVARFALEPGVYRIEVRYSSGLTRGRQITVAGSPLRGLIDEKTPTVE
jgi:hypothetical protein